MKAQRAAGLLLTCLLAAASSASAVAPTQRKPDKIPASGQAASFAPGRLIVKYRSDLKRCAHCLLAKRERFATALNDFSGSLDELNSRFRVKAAKSLFIERHALSTADAQSRQRARTADLSRRNPKRAQRVRPDAQAHDLTNIYVLELPDDANVREAARQYQADPHVEYAQPDFRTTATWTPNDPYYASSGSWGQPYEDLWGLKRIQAGTAWDTARGQGMVIAIVDTGVDHLHPDLAANIWVNPGEAGGNGVDDDGNGFVDDIRGWDFAYGDANPQDGFGHGTHVAGIVAAVGNNALGIVGAAPQARIMVVQGLDNTGNGFSSDLADSIVYAAEEGADVINNSWGCTAPCPSNPVAEEAVRFAHGLGAVVVFAAGNNAGSVNDYSPQNMLAPKPVVVGATTRTDALTFFTNTGLLLDLSAPGGGSTSSPPSYEPFRDILSLKSSACASAMCDPGLLVGSGYLRQAGTSMAAPYVAGIAALVAQARPLFTQEDIRQALRASADDIGAAGTDTLTGAGRLNAAKAVTLASVLRVAIAAPAHETSVAREAGPIDIVGTAAGASFADYQVSYGAGDSPSTWTSIGSVKTTAKTNAVLATWPISSVPTGEYTLRVRAHDTAGRTYEAFSRVQVEPYITQAVTTDPAIQDMPAVSSTHVVWTDQRNGASNLDIYAYDIAAGTEQRLSTNASRQWDPAVSGTGVVWVDERHGNRDIYLYDLATHTERRLTSDPADQWRPAISGELVVWEDLRHGQAEIYAYDLGTNTERRLTNDSIDQHEPDISGTQAVYYTQSSSQQDVYLYDLAGNTERRITNDSADQWAPKISGQRIVWTEENTAGSSPDIHLFDLATNARSPLTTAAAAQDSVVITDRWAAWRDVRHGQPDIYLYDFSTDDEERITAHPGEQEFPALSNRSLVWVDWRTADIYLVDLNEAPVLAGIGNRNGSAGQLLQFTVAATDANGDDLAFSGSNLPAGASVDPATGLFAWTPSGGQVGVHANVVLQVSDGLLMDTETITITVGSSPGALAFQASAGQVVMDAEHFDNAVARSGKAWTVESSVGGFAGDGYMTVLPNTGGSFNSSYVTDSPELVFNVNFADPGTYYVWVRGRGDSGSDDSLHAGIDGTGPASADRMDGYNSPSAWVWKRQTLDGVSATLEIPNAGLHTIHLWMREDGLRVDRVLLRKSTSSTAPSGSGPAESPRGPAGPDTSPPVISSIEASEITSTSATITWLTDEPATSQVDYGETAGYELGSELDEALVTDHTVVLSGLSPGTLYHFRVNSLDGTGNNQSVSDDATFTTLAAAGSQAFQESAGQVVIEAEHVDDALARSGKAWTLQSAQSGFRAEGYMSALPNTGTTINSGYAATSPELAFNVNFTNTGTYYCWVRGSAANANDDSVHLGIDGTMPSTADRLSGFGTGWTWRRTTMDSSAACRLTVSAPGPHTIHLWMREDGVKIDRLLLRKNSSSTAPSGSGPSESPRQ